MRTVKVGEKYRHFKGMVITVIAIAKDTEDLHKVVVYDHDGDIWARPYDMFMDEVNKNGQKYRFELQKIKSVNN